MGFRKVLARCVPGIGSLCLFAVVASTVAASELTDPPVAARPGGLDAEAPADGRLDVSVALKVAYREGTLWNPKTQRSDRVKLRSYLVDGIEPSGFIGPTLEVRPGDTLRVHLENALPADDPSCQTMPDNINIPHCFNSTNLHTHGLWVSPSGNSDNIFLTLRPGVSFQHEYAIPADHPAGTFWYHPHLHGSTALQVSSGMAGVLIVRGDRMPTADQSGDLDVLLGATEAQPFRERILVFQQLAYACRDDAGRIRTMPETDDAGIWVCDEGDVGEIERYLGPDPPNQFGGGIWSNSGRHTSINGMIVPAITGIRAGEFERWRMIHAGVRDTVKVEIHRMGPDAPDPRTVSMEDMPDFIAEHCIGDDLALFLAAADGLTLDRIQETRHAVLQPGYRWDMLVAFPEPGRYCILDGEDGIGAGLSQGIEAPPRVIAVAEVEGNGAASTGATALTEALVGAARDNIAEDILATVIADLQNGLRLDAFAPHDSLMDRDVDGTQEVVYNIDISTDPVSYEVNGNPFDPSDVRLLRLGAVEDWVLSSTWEGHPHHIHTNPFQVIEVLDPNGKDVSGPDAVDDYTGSVDPQFRGLKGVWKDTIWVKNPVKAAEGAYTVRVRTTYRRYVGRAVLHCHILDHEDQGMMQTIEFVLPDGSGGAMASGHGGHGGGHH